MNPSSVDGGIMFLSFSVMIITQNSSFIELLTFSSPISTSRSGTKYFYANSTLFDYGGPANPILTRHVQWVTGLAHNASTTRHNYWRSVYVYAYTPGTRSYEIRVVVSGGGQVYLTGIKLHVLLISKSNPVGSTAYYYTITAEGSVYSKVFSHNLGVPTDYFGEPSTGRSCLHGLRTLDLYLYKNINYPLSTSFLF